MKNSNDNPTPRDLEALQTRLALRLTAGLTELCAKRSTPDIDERLRVARRQALERVAAARHAAPAHASRVGMRGAVLAGRGTRQPQDEERTPWWLRLAALLPLVMLIAGLALIQQIYQRDQIVAAAEIDAALLTDDLPPSAYADPGFAAFLKTPPQE